MKKIVVTNPMGFSAAQRSRLADLGDVTFYDDHPASPDEWLKRGRGFDAICSWMFGLREKYSQLKNVFISVPFVGVGSFADTAVLKAKNITLCNSPGSNRHAASEWIIYMILTIMRQLDSYVNTSKKLTFPLPQSSRGLAGKTITILGKGNVGKRVGAVCEALDMRVTYLRRGDTIRKMVKDADIVVDVLSANPTTKHLLNKTFFTSLKRDAVFLSITVDSIVDINAMIWALDKGGLSFVAHDVMNARPADTTDALYTKLRKHPKIFATPHIAFHSDVTNQVGNDMMIDNLEAWLHGRPINVFAG